MHVIQIISNKVWGGGERYALDLSRRLQADGTRVTAAIRKSATPVIEKFAEAKVDFVTMPLGGAFDIVTPIRLSKLIDKNHTPGELAIIHVHNFKDAAVAVKARKLLTEAKDVKIICTRHLVAPAKTDAMHRDLYGQIDHIIFVSEAARREFFSTIADPDKIKASTVHNGIHPHPTLPREKAEATLGIFAGRITPEKGLDTLIAAMEKMRHPEFRLKVCGTGRGRDVMPLVRQARALEVDSRIDWLGHVADVDVEAAGCAIGIVPSTARESFGMSIAEFMLDGLAVVTTNNGAQPEIITDGEDGILVPPADPTALAAALDSLLDNPERIAQLAQNGHRTITERFGYEDFYRKVTAIYRL